MKENLYPHELFQATPTTSGGSGTEAPKPGLEQYEAVPGRSADAVTSESALIQAIRDSIAKGNADARTRALMEQVLALTDSIKKNADVNREIDASTARLAPFLVLFGRMLNAVGLENNIEGFVKDNSDIFKFDGVLPDLGPLSGFTGTAQNPLENKTVVGDIRQGTGMAIETERRVPGVLKETIDTLPGQQANMAGSVAREYSLTDITTAAGKLSGTQRAAAATNFTATDANGDKKLSGAEVTAFVTKDPVLAKALGLPVPAPSGP